MKCAWCNNTLLRHTATRADKIKIFTCDECSLASVESIVDSIHLDYERDYFISQEAEVTRGYSDYNMIGEDNYYWILFMIDQLIPNRGDLLDIGCATGTFMQAASKIGWRTKGVDVSQWAIAQAKSKELDVVHGTLNEAKFDDACFDVLFCIDVLEHVPDLRSFLEECRRILKPNGYLVILTPDNDAAAKKGDGDSWIGYNTSLEHIHYLGKKYLRSINAGIFNDDLPLIISYDTGKFDILCCISQNRSLDKIVTATVPSCVFIANMHIFLNNLIFLFLLDHQRSTKQPIDIDLSSDPLLNGYKTVWMESLNELSKIQPSSEKPYELIAGINAEFVKQ